MKTPAIVFANLRYGVHRLRCDTNESARTSEPSTERPSNGGFLLVMAIGGIVTTIVTLLGFGVVIITRFGARPLNARAVKATGE